LSFSSVRKNILPYNYRFATHDVAQLYDDNFSLPASTIPFFQIHQFINKSLCTTNFNDLDNRGIFSTCVVMREARNDPFWKHPIVHKITYRGTYTSIFATLRHARTPALLYYYNSLLQIVGKNRYSGACKFKKTYWMMKNCCS
jgi:hypothetical protein